MHRSKIIYVFHPKNIMRSVDKISIINISFDFANLIHRCHSLDNNIVSLVSLVIKFLLQSFNDTDIRDTVQVSMLVVYTD